MRALFVILALAGCAKPPPQTQLPALDYLVFKQQVESELMGSCGYSNCHGQSARPMRIYALAGTRIRPGLSSAELLEEEHRANFERARSYAAPTNSELPDILRKPLQLEQGGAGHTGVDRFGSNVYGSKADVRWKLLDDWVNGRLAFDAGQPEPDAGTTADGGVPDAGMAPTCVEQLPFGFAANIAPLVNVATCSDSACHSQENIAAGDAGCFDPTSCLSIRSSGCNGTRSVVPCNRYASKLYRYTGVPPFFKSHQGKLLAQHAAAIGAWIDAGAPCD